MLPVQPRVDFAGDPAGETWHGLELFEGGAHECLRGTEVVQDLLFTRRPDAGEFVEDGGGHGLCAHSAVVGVGETVGLVADALEQVEFRRVGFQPHRLRAARLEDLLVALGERAQRDVWEVLADVELLEDRGNGGELALASVEQDQVRRGQELLVLLPEPLQAASDHLCHARGVVGALYGPDLEPPVLLLRRDRKSTRLNSSHTVISYAVFCLKKKKKTKKMKQLIKKKKLRQNKI